MERKKIIVITPEEGKYLQKLFGVSHVTVWHAVKYVKDNPIHRKIRKAAIERGGQQMVLSPEFDTIHLVNRKDADPEQKLYMLQWFENGATLEACRTTGHVEIRDRDGKVRGAWDNILFADLYKIQEEAANL